MEKFANVGRIASPGEFSKGVSFLETFGERHASACRYKNEVPEGSRRSRDSFLVARSVPRVGCVQRSATRHYQQNVHLVCFAPLHTPYFRLLRCTIP